ncbi:uncharacterized protein LOC120001630 isoform X2 [Tripterygium wilfordii]|uniref:uncharacterized protein LOC120001630 isoform X2 n=1 Tax=Tripterygium wilfordii TaxID=458696 RepID=UPI0018F84D12|nr:uncharacterized protein LOC120001630 isoform X2 [Tripterygium wilfordii]
MLELVLKSYEQKLEGCSAGVFSLRFSCLVLQPFSKFLRVHPIRKNGFHDLVNKLLEPLLHLLAILQLQSAANNSGWTRNLQKVGEEVLSHGLFHSVHIDGFLSLQGMEKYSVPTDGKSEDSKMVNKSYHRHLFDKLEKMAAAKKEFVLIGVGELFHILVDQVKKRNGASMLYTDSKVNGKSEDASRSVLDLSGHVSKMFSGSDSARPDKSYFPGNLNSGAKKSLINFFAHVMDPLLRHMNGYVQAKMEVGPLLLDAHCVLKSINSLLASFIREKLYVKAEDFSEGACLNFLKKIYDAIVSAASNLLCFSNQNMDVEMQKLLASLAKELLAALGYLLDIEYEVTGNDLTILWLIILSFLALGSSFTSAVDQCLLTSQILDLGCQLVKLYSELRQVENIVFSLCKGIRLIMTCDIDHEQSYASFLPCTTSPPYGTYRKSVEILLCSREFNLTVHKAIKSIPEGNAKECIRLLILDFSESMAWMKEGCSLAGGKELGGLNVESSSMLGFDQQAELFGRGLSEMYALVVDSLIVTTGNSSLVADSIEDLMNVIRPYMCNLVGELNAANDFLFFVVGSAFDYEVGENSSSMLKFRASSHWVFVFFFRMYISCRNLYRQTISLMAPDKARKKSAAMGDSFTAFSGRDWIEKTDWTKEGYFSWILQPSNSLLTVIQSVSDIYLKDGISDCFPVIPVFLMMALQRLVDLNRQIKSLDYLLQTNDLLQLDSLDDGELSSLRKKNKKWRRRLSVLKQEAVSLTEFMMGYLPMLSSDPSSIFFSDDAACTNALVQNLQESDKWDFGLGTLTMKSLPTAIWWILCQNTDIWGAHAAKRKLKMFLSLLICASLPSMRNGFAETGKHPVDKAGLLKLTLHQISSELLSDAILYENKFVCRHLPSRFCHILEKSVLPLFNNLPDGDLDFDSSPNWAEVLSALENSSRLVSSRKSSIHDFSQEKLIACSSDKLPSGICQEQKALKLTGDVKFTDCRSLLDLLCWMPKGYMNSRSFPLYATYILNLERLIVRSLLECQDALSSHANYELLKLLVSCRRVLKYLLMEFCEKTEASQCLLIPFFSESSFIILWLFKSVSVVIRLQEALLGKNSDKGRETMFSLIDHTSHVLLTLSRYQFRDTVHSLLAAGSSSVEDCCSGVAHEQNYSIKDMEICKSVSHIAESLKEQMQNLHTLKGSFSCEEVEVSWAVVYINQLSCIVSCFSGLFWGLASVLNCRDAEASKEKVKSRKRKCKDISELDIHINVFSDFVSLFLQMFVIEDHEQPWNSYNAHSLQESDNKFGSLDSGASLLKKFDETDILCCEEHLQTGAAVTCLASSVMNDDSPNARGHTCGSQLENTKCPSSILGEVDPYECVCLNKHFLRSFLKGDHPEFAFLLRELLIAFAAILRLNLKIRYTPLFSKLVPIFIGISEVLLLEFANMTEMPLTFSFVWLDGILKYLEEIASQFPLTNPTLTRNLYARLIVLHLKALGKCIFLQGKEATLASHETESSTKTLASQMGSSEAGFAHGKSFLDEFKARLRMSFKVLIKNASELHMLSAIQAIERALVGVQEDGTVIYNIKTGSIGGGKVSPIVAAGIDCLDLVLEYASGRKHLSVVKRHIQGFIAGLFNIILHLQNPLIFYERTVDSKIDSCPDQGSVILMCVEVLTRISGKHSLFQMDSWHVGQALHIPAALFQDFHQLGRSEAPVPSHFSLVSNNQDCDSAASLNPSVVDRQFSVELFAACCRLLYTVLKHHKSESEQCIVLLEESTCVLLYCLETVDTSSPVGKECFSWKVQEGVKCASFLRRIYEELRQQKDVFGRHCFNFLSAYIWVYSGYGPLKTGIKREIDEALRPGVYALIDTCSADDLQYLHTAFGEGPCRNTLATLKHDYKMNFQYGGKV